MSTITIKQPEPGNELVRLLNSGRSDELNVDGKSYRPDARGAFHVPRRHVTPELLTVGAFYPARLSKAEGLQDVAKAINALPPGREKEALNAALVSLCEDAPEA
jgi:hypothetical protein